MTFLSENSGKCSHTSQLILIDENTYLSNLIESFFFTLINKFNKETLDLLRRIEDTEELYNMMFKMNIITKDLILKETRWELDFINQVIRYLNLSITVFSVNTYLHNLIESFFMLLLDKFKEKTLDLLCHIETKEELYNLMFKMNILTHDSSKKLSHALVKNLLYYLSYNKYFLYNNSIVTRLMEKLKIGSPDNVKKNFYDAISEL